MKRKFSDRISERLNQAKYHLELVSSPEQFVGLSIVVFEYWTEERNIQNRTVVGNIVYNDWSSDIGSVIKYTTEIKVWGPAANTNRDRFELNIF